MLIGEVIREWRKSKGLTLKQVAGDIGIPLPTLHRVEKGDDMDGKTLLKVLLWGGRLTNGQSSPRRKESK